MLHNDSSRVGVGGWPVGFHGYTGHGGLRETGDDISFVVSDRPAVSAAMFTKSLFAGPAVVLSREHAADAGLRAVITLAQNANVATGSAGKANAIEVVAQVAELLGIAEGEVLIGSTGVIGRPLPMDTIRTYFEQTALAGLSGREAAPLDVTRAMMTTDTRPKTAVRQMGSARIVAVAKGVGMLEPDMATMLAYLFTDAQLTAAALDSALRSAVERSFNCLSIDTDTSTSDTVAIIANGAAGPVHPDEFADALADICLDLTKQLARDGEGATKLIQVRVGRARDDAQAKRVAKSVVNSPLVKTAVHGADPNWGRIVMAIGKNTDDHDIDPTKVTIALEVYPAEATPHTLERLVAAMHRSDIDIDIDLGIARGQATVYGCDLSPGYIRINADYTS